MLQPQLTPEQQIQIEAARPPELFPRSVAAELLFQPLELIQQLQCGGLAWRGSQPLHQHHGIAVAGLVRGATYGGGVVKG